MNATTTTALWALAAILVALFACPPAGAADSPDSPDCFPVTNDEGQVTIHWECVPTESAPAPSSVQADPAVALAGR